MPTHDHLVCDLSHAPDSPGERMTAYQALFTSLVGRDSWTRGFRFRFDTTRLDQTLLERLVALESACCPFLRSCVTESGDEVWWDLEADSDDAVPFLQAAHDLPEILAVASPSSEETDAVLAATGVPFRLRADGPH